MSAGDRRENGARSHHLEVRRTARYYTLGHEVAEPEEIWFACHGYRQAAGRFLRRFRELDDGRRLIVAPEGLSRFYVDPAPGPHGPQHRVGASWMTREDRQAEIADYVAYLDRLAGVVEGNVGRRRTVVLGFSQGVHTVARWVTLGRMRPDVLVLWGAGLPPDLDMERAAPVLRDLELVLVCGLEDATTDPVRQAEQEALLARWDVPYVARTHPGGHDLDGDLLRALAG